MLLTGAMRMGIGVCAAAINWASCAGEYCFVAGPPLGGCAFFGLRTLGGALGSFGLFFEFLGRPLFLGILTGGGAFLSLFGIPGGRPRGLLVGVSDVLVLEDVDEPVLVRLGPVGGVVLGVISSLEARS